MSIPVYRHMTGSTNQSMMTRNTVRSFTTANGPEARSQLHVTGRYTGIYLRKNCAVPC